jgi:hypothetical protein
MATQYTRRLVIVVAAAAADACNTHAQAIDPDGGDRTFTVGLSATGSAPATHYWCGWSLVPAHDSAIRSRLAALVAANQARVYDGTAVTPDDVLGTLGLQRIGRS